MLINSLGLKNFKCFEELDVKFAPITLLTGANSSGKSSLINAILAVLQTEGFPLYLSPNGKYVDMGSMKEMVHCGDLDRIIDLNIYFDLTVFEKRSSISFFKDNIFSTSWVVNKENELPTLKSFLSKRDYTEVYVREVENNILVDIVIGDFGQDDDSEERYSAMLNELKNIIKERPGINVSEYNKFIKISNVEYSSIDELENELSALDRWFFFDEEINVAVFRYKNFVDADFNYMGSFRGAPLRTYNQKSKSMRKISIDGDGYIDQLIEWQERDVEKFNALANDAHNLGLFDEIRPNRLQGGRFELTVRTSNSTRWTSLADIGFGVSQFLPILVADHQLGRKSCLAISQPEIHLHPKIQAQFGNYLSNQIKRTKKQYIVETHSEYLLNRIRLLLVTGELKPEDVRILYFENDGVKSTVHNVEFTTDGQIKGAPQGFFDTYGIDVMDIALNAH